MSTFKENFGRSEDENLNYDDTAFYYFSFGILGFAMVPLTYLLVIRPMYDGEKVIKTSIMNCQCETCADRMRKRQALYRFAFFNKAFLAKVIAVAIGWMLCLHCYSVVKDVEPLAGFVPHEILGVDARAEVSEIKRAYRKLSRAKHPDKNPDNPKAVAEFI